VTTVLLVLMGLLLAALVPVGAFAWTIRRVLRSEAAPDVRARVLPGPPRLEVTVSLQAGARAVRIESISLPRVLTRFGAAPPSGFRVADEANLDRWEFEPDLEELAETSATPTEAELEVATEAQYREARRLADDFGNEFVTWEGRWNAKGGRRSTLVVPLEYTGPVEGTCLVTYSQRAGLWRFTSGTSGPVEDGVSP
jgi:hypothetical protein